MKKIIIAILSLCILMTSTISYASNNMIFYKDQTKVYFDNQFVDILNGEGISPTIKDGIFYVPIRPFVELKNGSIVWKNDGGKVTADFAVGSYYTIEQNSKNIVEYNGNNDSLSAEVFLNTNYNRLMVPADTFEKLGYKIIQGEDYLGIFAISENEDVIGVSFDNENNAITEATVKYSLLNDKGDVYVNDISNVGDIINTTIGGLGSSIDINVVNGSVNKATISFTYDETKLNGINENDLKIVWYNEILGRMEILENSSLDTANNVLSVETSHFSKYSVVDSKAWYEAWAQTQLIKRDSEKGNGLFNVNLVLDTSGSMGGSINLLKETVINFINGLNDNDIVNVITFSNGANTIIDSKLKVNSDYENIIKQISATGGTDMLAGLNEVSSNDIIVAPVYPTEEEQRAYEQEAQIQNLKNSATTVTILLSDGSPDSDNDRSDILDKCRAISYDGKFISIALGSGSDSSLMKSIAEETNGLYKYINDSNGLLEMFTQISGEVIGLEEDTDGDGIPDLIETTGMRDQAGNIFTTNPNNSDSDGDMLSDGDEMGIFVSENGGYFIRESNPNIFTTFSSIAELESNNISASFVDYDGKFQIKLNMKVLAESLTEKTVFTASGKMVNNSAMETIYANVQNLKIELSNLPECIETNTAPYNVSVAEAGHSYNYTIQAKCKKGGLKCNNKHNICFIISGDNLDPVTINQDIDLKSIVLNQATKDFDDVQKKVANNILNKATSKMTDIDNEQNTNNSDVLSKVNITWTGSYGAEIPKDIETAVKVSTVNLIASQEGLEQISLNGSQMVKDSAKLVGMINDETIEQTINGVRYNVKFNGFAPTISIGDRILGIAFINGECYDIKNPAKKYTFNFTKMDNNEFKDFLQAYNSLLDNLNKEAWNEAGKEHIKAIIKAWDISSLITELTDDILKDLDVYDAVNLYKKGMDIHDTFIKDGGTDVDGIGDYIKDYQKSYNKIDLGDYMIEKTIDALVDLFN